MTTGVAIPSYVYMKLFDNCNARCNMCDCWQTRSSRLSPAHYNTVVERLAMAGVREIRLTGGEPLLYHQLPAVIENAARLGIRVSLITNGWLLPTLLPGLLAAGCQEVVISVDGLRPAHDRIRGTNGLFDRCLKAMAMVKAAGLALAVNTVLQQSNVNSLMKLARPLLVAERAPLWWHLIPVRDQPELRPTAAQIALLRTNLPRLRDVCHDAGTWLVTEDDMFEPYGRAPCRVPQSIAYVDGESGQVHGCNMLAYVDDPIGNVLTTSLPDIYRGASATRLRGNCAAGTYSGCDRCDTSSRGMNLLFIKRSTSESPASS